ncbi:Major capsid protein [Bacillus pseudomycoides]|nr:Major capsid protein [Bacillus pseudomycoides]
MQLSLIQKHLFVVGLTRLLNQAHLLVLFQKMEILERCLITIGITFWVEQKVELYD